MTVSPVVELSNSDETEKSSKQEVVLPVNSPSVVDDTIGSKRLFPIRYNHKSGFIDRNGNIIIEPRFDGVDEFSEGLAAARIGGRDLYIDEEGKIAIETGFSGYDCDLFSEGIASIRNRVPSTIPKLGNRVTYVNKLGNVICEFEIVDPNDLHFDSFDDFLDFGDPDGYYDFFRFQSGRGRIKIDGKWGYINAIHLKFTRMDKVVLDIIGN